MDVMDFLYMDEREMCRHFILTFAKARKAAGEDAFTKAEIDAGFQFVKQLQTDVTLLSLFLRGEVSFSLNDDDELTVTKIRQEGEVSHA